MFMYMWVVKLVMIRDLWLVFLMVLFSVVLVKVLGRFLGSISFLFCGCMLLMMVMCGFCGLNMVLFGLLWWMMWIIGVLVVWVWCNNLVIWLIVVLMLVSGVWLVVYLVWWLMMSRMVFC